MMFVQVKLLQIKSLNKYLNISLNTSLKSKKYKQISTYPLHLIFSKDWPMLQLIYDFCVFISHLLIFE